MVLLMLMPQFYAVNVTGVLQRGEFRMNQAEQATRFQLRRALGRVEDTQARAPTPHLVNGIQAGDFAGE